MSDYEFAVYRLLKIRGNIPGITYREYMISAKEVVKTFSPGKIIPVEKLVERLEEALKR